MKMNPRTIVIGGLAVVLTVIAVVVFIPLAVFKPAPTITTTKYTALEQQGLELYKANGCVYCHSQFTRPNDHSTSRASRAGQYVYDQPHQLGTLRTGPDLGNIGLKRGDFWERSTSSSRGSTRRTRSCRASGSSPSRSSTRSSPT